MFVIVQKKRDFNVTNAQILMSFANAFYILLYIELYTMFTIFLSRIKDVMN